MDLALQLRPPYMRDSAWLGQVEFALLAGRQDQATTAVTEGLRGWAERDPDRTQTHPDDSLWYPLALRLEADRAEQAAARRASEEVAEARRRAAPLVAELDRLEAAPPPQARYPYVNANLLVARAEQSRLEGRSDHQRWRAAAVAWEQMEHPFESAYAHFREAEALLADRSSRPQAEQALRRATRRRWRSARHRCAARSKCSPSAAAPAPMQAGEPAAGEGGDRNELLRQMGTVLANVTVLTALLVYFGWVRSEVQSDRLGVNESIFGMSTREYLLRSVQPVLQLLVVVAMSGLLWLLADRWLLRRLQDHGTSDPVVRWSLRLLPAALVVLPLTDWLAGFVWPALAFIAFPLCGVAGLLLVLYAFYLRQRLPGALALPAGREALLRALTAIIVGVGLFWAAANYATVEGIELARRFVDEVPGLPRVVVYSPAHLHIDAPGAREEPLPPEQSAYKFRYLGLRLLEHTGGHYFLISDDWSPRCGVVVMLADDDPVRLEFVRDRR